MTFLSRSPLLAFFLVWIAQHSHAMNWDKAISAVQEKADLYHEYAVEVGGTSWAGAMYNHYKFNEHQCAILGRMLEMQSAIRHIEEFAYPPMSAESDPHELLIFSISLESWVAAAKWALGATEGERKNVWNLDCVGNFDIARSLYVESDQPNAEFEVIGTQLQVYGDIEAGFAKRFIAFLEQHPDVDEVALGSAGGSVADAFFAGLAVRKKGLNTTIKGNCYSACPIVFLGGVRRVLWASPHSLGFHQIYQGDGVPISFDEKAYVAVANYANRMGADPSTLLSWMQSTAPSEMYLPSPEELCAAGVATFVQRRCGSDIP